MGQKSGRQNYCINCTKLTQKKAAPIAWAPIAKTPKASILGMRTSGPANIFTKVEKVSEKKVMPNRPFRSSRTARKKNSTDIVAVQPNLCGLHDPRLMNLV